MSLILPYLPNLMQGLVVTLKVAGASYLVGLGIAVVAVFCLNFGPRPLRWLIRSYVAVIRGLPELLVIFLVFYGGTILLTSAFGRYVEVDALSAGITALSFVAGAYLIEILRGALQSIPEGQWEAGRSLGLSTLQSFARIIMPQMWSHALPGLGNQWLVVLKESALVSIVGLEELMRTGVIAAGATHAPMTFYLIVAALYVAITSVSTLILRYADARTQWAR